MTLFGQVFSPSFLALLVIWVAGTALALTLEVKRLRGRQTRSGTLLHREAGKCHDNSPRALRPLDRGGRRISCRAFHQEGGRQ